MQPSRIAFAIALLGNELVEGEPHDLVQQQAEESAVSLGGACGDVGGAACGVLAVMRASYGGVHGGRAVAAVDVKRRAPQAPQRVEDVAYEVLQVLRGGGLGRIRKSSLSCGLRLGEFLQCEIL